MSFSEIWERLSSETDIKNLSQLAEVVESTQPHVSRKKKNNDFPSDWAVKIGRKYNLMIEWILTGQGPKRLSDLQNCKDIDFSILIQANEWLKELVVNEPYRHDWFRASFEDAFPMFREWMKRKEEEESKNSSTPDSKIA